MVLTSHAVLYIAVNKENNELLDKYTLLAKTHNKQVCDDPFPNSGVDLYFPEQTVLSTLNSQFVSMKIQCEMRIFNHDTKSWKPTGYYLYPRSSMSKTPLMLANQTGIIDSGYRGNIIGAFRNISGSSQPFVVEKHSRLLQICSPDLRPIIIQLVDVDFFETTVRNEGGFGSTGK